MRKKNGFSLVEVIVAAVIFALVIVGLMGVFMAASKHLTHARERMSSAQLGKFFLDPLQADVRQDTWDQIGNELKLTPIGTPRAAVFSPQTINKNTFSGVHDVSAIPGMENLRRVITTITWDEHSS